MSRRVSLKAALLAPLLAALGVAAVVAGPGTHVAPASAQAQNRVAVIVHTGGGLGGGLRALRRARHQWARGPAAGRSRRRRPRVLRPGWCGLRHQRRRLLGRRLLPDVSGPELLGLPPGRARRRGLQLRLGRRRLEPGHGRVGRGVAVGDRRTSAVPDGGPGLRRGDAAPPAPAPSPAPATGGAAGAEPGGSSSGGGGRATPGAAAEAPATTTAVGRHDNDRCADDHRAVRRRGRPRTTAPTATRAAPWTASWPRRVPAGTTAATRPRPSCSSSCSLSGVAVAAVVIRRRRAR